MTKEELDDFIKENMEVPLMIRFEDNKIITNYWDKMISKKGYFYIVRRTDWYALLVPQEKSKEFINEIKTAKEIVISRGIGTHVMPPQPDYFEIMFEDKSDCPYSITVSKNQWDILPGDDLLGWKGTFSIYCNNNEGPDIIFKKVHYRKVETLPCLVAVEE